MTTRRVWDDDSHAFIEVDVLYSGGPLPWQKEPASAWSGTGSLSAIQDRGHKRGSLIDRRDTKGKGLSGNNWREPFGNHSGAALPEGSKRCACGRVISASRARKRYTKCERCRRVAQQQERAARSARKPEVRRRRQRAAA